MRLLVIGARGQLARSFLELQTPPDITLVAIGRPGLDLLNSATIMHWIDNVEPDLVVNAGAYTAVDMAESERELAYAINSEGAGRVAEACARGNRPLIHISTDYVFDGNKSEPYREDCPASPLSIYGRSKLDGERHVAAACPRHVILRTARLHSPFGQNFVKTMLKLAGSHSELRVVDDQVGNPTYAPHLAAGVITLVQKIFARSGDSELWGIYHAAGSGEASWYRLALEIFNRSEKLGGPVARVHPITTAEYPTLARRPANSRLDCSKLASVGVRLPHWSTGVAECVSRLVM